MNLAGNGCLQVACAMNNHQFVKILLDLGCDPQEIDDSGIFIEYFYFIYFYFIIFF